MGDAQITLLGGRFVGLSLAYEEPRGWRARPKGKSRTPFFFFFVLRTQKGNPIGALAVLGRSGLVSRSPRGKRIFGEQGLPCRIWCRREQEQKRHGDPAATPCTDAVRLTACFRLSMTAWRENKRRRKIGVSGPTHHPASQRPEKVTGETVLRVRAGNARRL